MGFDDGFISFLGESAGGPGHIFTTLGGELASVLQEGAVIDGLVATGYGTYGHGLDGNLITINIGSYGGAGRHANFVAMAYRTAGIDIKPGDSPNTINRRSQGSIPVAILSRPGSMRPSTSSSRRSHSAVQETRRACLTVGAGPSMSTATAYAISSVSLTVFGPGLLWETSLEC